MPSQLQVDKIIDAGATSNKELAEYSSSAWSWGQGVPKGSVIEQFCSPCNGSTITVQSGSYTVETTSGSQGLTDSYADITGSKIDYTPPTGTQTVIYEYTFTVEPASAHNIAHMKLFLDNDSGTATEVTNARCSLSAESWWISRQTIKWAFHIGGSDDDAIGRRDTWTSARTIKLQGREYDSSYQMKLNVTHYWDGGGSDQFSQPVIGITALA